MSHSPSLTAPRTLLVLLSSSLALACQKEAPKPAAEATTAGTPGTPVVAEPEAATPADSGEQVPGDGVNLGLMTDPAVLGHFMLAEPSQLLADVRTQLVPQKYAGFLEESTLRSLASMGLEKRGALALNFDLAAPLGCALVEPSSDDPQMSCVFGYKGGATAFAGDLGDEHRQADPAGHTAAFGLEGKVAYIDALGERVVVSSGADTFKKTQHYLQRNLLDRARKVHGDFEVVAQVSTIFERYRDVIEPALQAMNTSSPPQTGNPALDGAMQAFTRYSQRSSQTGLMRMAELDQFSMFLSVEPEGVALGGAMVPRPGSRMATEMAMYGAPRLDPGFAGTAPSGTAMMFAMNMSPKGAALPSMVETRQMIAEAWGAFTGREPAAIAAALTAFQQENAALYEGHTLVALGREPGALFGLMAAARLQSGTMARDSWKAWSASFTPEAVLGANFSKYLTWRFTADASTVDGVAVDRWTIEPGPASMALLKKEMDPKARAFVDQALGGLFLNIDRAEAAGSVIYTIAPKAEASYMQRALGAAQGQGSVAGAPGLARALARDPRGSGLFAVDLRQGLEWVRDLQQFGAPTQDLPQQLGTDLGDVYLTVRYTEEGAMTMEYMFSQQLIAQVQRIIPE